MHDRFLALARARVGRKLGHRRLDSGLATAMCPLPHALRGHLALFIAVMACAAVGVMVWRSGLFPMPAAAVASGTLGLTQPLGLVVVGAALLALLSFGLRQRRPGASAFEALQAPQLDAYEAAYLAGGPTRVLSTALVEAGARGWLSLERRRDARGLIRAAHWRGATPSLPLREPSPSDAGAPPGDPYAAADDPALHPVMQALAHALRPSQRADTRALARAIEPAVAALQQRLAQAGLATVAGERPLADALVLLACIPLLAAAWLYTHQGLAPVLAWAVTAVLAWVHSRAAVATGDGQLAAWALRERVRLTRPSWPPEAAATPADRRYAEGLAALPLSFALLGSAVLMGDAGFVGINLALRQAGDAAAATGWAQAPLRREPHRGGNRRSGGGCGAAADGGGDGGGCGSGCGGGGCGGGGG